MDNDNNDFIDEYLSKIDNCVDSKSSFFGDKGVKNLQRCLTDLFGAGSETTTTVLLFSFLYMLKYPDIQVSFSKYRISESENSKIKDVALLFCAPAFCTPHTYAVAICAPALKHSIFFE